MDIITQYNKRMEIPIVARFQNARWVWVNKELQKLGYPKSIADFGCLDGRLLNRLSYAPDIYYGLDSDPHSLFTALNKNQDKSIRQFLKIETAQDVARELPPVDVIVALEVMYYLQDKELVEMLKVFKSKAKKAVLISVLNETGLFFLARQLSKRVGIIGMDNLAASYSWSTIARQTLGVEAPDKRNGRYCFSAGMMRSSLESVFSNVTTVGMPFSLPYRFDAFSTFICK
jgi:hypothetical protein